MDECAARQQLTRADRGEAVADSAMEIAGKEKWYYIVTEKIRVSASSVINSAAETAAIPARIVRFTSPAAIRRASVTVCRV